MARNPKPVRRLYKTIQAGVRNRFGRPLGRLTYDHVRDAMRPVTVWEWSSCEIEWDDRPEEVV